MEAEEYIQDHTRRCSNELVSVESIDGKEVMSYYPWMTVEGALEAVRIAREELSHSEVTKTCPRYDQEAVSDDLEDEIKRFWKNRCDAFSEEEKICECARHFANWQKVKMIEKAYEWIRCNWRKYVWKDGDEIVHFGHWEKPFRKAMEE